MIRDGSGTRLDHALEWEEDNTNASRFSTSGADEAVRKMKEKKDGTASSKDTDSHRNEKSGDSPNNG